jgi:hypothetical protein
MVLDDILYQHRTRNYAMDQRKRSDLSLLAFLRMQLGWQKALPEAERKAIAAQAKALAAAPDGEWAGVIIVALAARAPFETVEKDAAREMERLAKTLPVWDAWGAGVPGFGARSLAVLVGEAGDLGEYPKKGHLWKRMGLSVEDGIRQGGLAKSASKGAWVAHGYSPARRSTMFIIGDCLIKQQGPYREVYLARKEYERQRAEAEGLAVVPAAKIPKGQAGAYRSEGHVHRRAQRYMEKIFLRDIRNAWVRAIEVAPARAIIDTPALTHTQDPDSQEPQSDQSGIG